MNEGPTVYVVDDDASYLAAVVRLLHAAGFEVQGFSSPTTLLESVSDQKPGCIVADLEMPRIDGLALQEILMKSCATLPVVFLTGRGDVPSAVRAMRGGAVDFLEKRAPSEQLIAAVLRALDRNASGRIQHARSDELKGRFAGLTPREREVLEHIVRGSRNRQIAADLAIHERTVNLHRAAIARKVGVRSVAELTVLTQQAGLFLS